MNVPPVCRERDEKRKSHSCVHLNKNALFSIGTNSLLGFVLGKRGNISVLKIAVWVFFLLSEWKPRQRSARQVVGFYFYLCHNDETFPPSNGILIELLGNPECPFRLC